MVDKRNYFEWVCIFIAKNGYCNGNPETVAQTQTRWVMSILDQIIFDSDYKEEIKNLNPL